MRIALRVFFSSVLTLALVLALARTGDPDCLRLTAYDYSGVVDLRTGHVFLRSPIAINHNYRHYSIAPNGAYLGFFQTHTQPNGDVTTDFRIVAYDELANLAGKPRVLYRDLPKFVEFDEGFAGAESAWLPDSRHILLHWLPDYAHFYFDGNDPPLTHTVHRFVIIDIYGNVSADYTLTLPLIRYDEVSAEIQDLGVIGFSADGKVMVTESWNSSSIEVWSVPAFQPLAEPIKVHPRGCYSPYEAGYSICERWSGSVMSVVAEQADGSAAVIIHDIVTGQRHTIPLPSAPSDRFHLSGWSPDGSYAVVSWYNLGSAMQLVFDRDGKTLAVLPNAAIEDGYDIPKQNWTADGKGLLYLDYDFAWNDYGTVGKLFLRDTQQLITLPAYLVTEEWYTGAAARGTQIGLVWNEVDEQGKPNAVKIGVVNTLTGAVSVLYTFNDRWIGKDERDGVRLQWLSDTRLMVTTGFARVWGNSDGTGWQALPESILVYENTLAPDGKSILVAQQDEGGRNVYAYSLDTAAMRLLMSTTDMPVALNLLQKSPGGRFVYRLLANSPAETSLQVLDTFTEHTYSVPNSSYPTWSPDGRQFVLITGDGNQQQIRLIDAATGEELRQLTRVPAAWEANATGISLGRCY